MKDDPAAPPAGLPEKQQDEVLREVVELERLDSVAELMRNLQP